MTAGSGIDPRFMRLALRLAARGRGRTSPNPMVGAVVVKGGNVVGRGFHRRAGTDHAEVVALNRAGRSARGSDLYVNLEPCNHVGRTGPCAAAIIKAGVRRVILGMRDPNPLVDGQGIRALKRAGIEVVCGIMEEESRRLNEAFACYIVCARPFVTYKAAVTLDGRVAARSGDSRWVSGEAARRESHRLRDASDAIMVGVGTVLRDDPELTCRDVVRGRDPLRIVVDSQLRTPPSARVVAAAARSSAPTWIVTAEGAPLDRERALTEAGAKVIRCEAERGRVAIPALLGELARRDIMCLLLEGGPTLAGSFWRAGLVDRVVAFIAPLLLGDPEALPMISGLPVAALSQATRLSRIEVTRVGEDLMVTGRVPPSVPREVR